MAVSLPFAFNLAGKDFASETTLTMRCDGHVSFGTAYDIHTPSNPGTTYSVISPLGYDQNLKDGESYMYYKVTGDEGSRILTMEWKNMRSYFGSGSSYNWANYQVKLYEGSNVVELCYGDFTYNYSTSFYTYLSANGHITNVTSAYANPVVTTNTSGTTTNISVNSSSTAPANGTIYRFYPPQITFEWSYTGTAGATNSDGDTYTVTPTENSSYTVSLTYDGCTKTETVDVTIAPAAPTNVQVTNIGLTTATASWSGSAGSYKWSIDGSTWNTTSSTTASLSGLTPGQTYTFQVKAVDGSCESSVASTTFTTQSTHTLSASVNPANSGTISDGVVKATLPQSCFAYIGPLAIMLQVVNGDVKTTVLKAVFRVVASSTGSPSVNSHSCLSQYSKHT